MCVVLLSVIFFKLSHLILLTFMYTCSTYQYSLNVHLALVLKVLMLWPHFSTYHFISIHIGASFPILFTWTYWNIVTSEAHSTTPIVSYFHFVVSFKHIKIFVFRSAFRVAFADKYIIIIFIFISFQLHWMSLNIM